LKFAWFAKRAPFTTNGCANTERPSKFAVLKRRCYAARRSQARQQAVREFSLLTALTAQANKNVEERKAYLPGFQHDLFISYSHRNEGEDKWVSRFHARLEAELGQLAKDLKIWRDIRRLEGNQLFDETIKTAIEGIGVLVALNSHAFKESDYCQQEVQWFCQRGQCDGWGLSIGDRKRIFNVLLNNLPRNEWHPAFSGTSGYPFHQAVPDDDIAFPHNPSSAKFRSSVQKLAGGIFKTLRSFRQSIENKAQTELSSSQATGSTSESQPSVLLDTHMKDDDYAFEVRNVLRTLNVKTFFNQSEDDPGESIKSLETRFKQLRRMIIVYGNVDEGWVNARRDMASDIANREKIALKLGIYYAPQRSKGNGGQFRMGSLTVYELDDADLRNPLALQPLLSEV
jgi:hypothetical protein